MKLKLFEKSVNIFQGQKKRGMFDTPLSRPTITAFLPIRPLSLPFMRKTLPRILRRPAAGMAGTLAGALVAFALLPSGSVARETTERSPFGDRPSAEETDLSRAYHPPAVHVMPGVQAVFRDGEIAGAFDAWNADGDAVGDLQYRIELFTEAPGEEEDGNPQTL